MRILLSWLNDFAPFGDPTAENADRLAAVMAHLGLEVDGVTLVGTSVPGVVTARVVRTEPHPDAAKVHRVYVDTGDGAEHHVWCGAFNMTAGDVVPLATLGTEMPDGRRIEARGILGIESEGMLCSARELGLGDDHTGILVLDPDVALGVPYGEALGLREDVVFDVDVTRNRPDCYGHLGVARDLAAHLGLPLTVPEPQLDSSGDGRRAAVRIVDGDRCGRFTSTIISGIRVGPSPSWMAQRLAHVGMRPINNVVDVSNYVMLELNQPNHAYDLGRLAEGAGGEAGFEVRLAHEGEVLTTLDGVERRLGPDDLLICDASSRPIGLAGIMGGLDTEIDDATSTVALEIAWFEPTGVGSSASRLGVRSEASARFERGVDPAGPDRAVARFVELLRETCPDLVVHPGADDARGVGLPAFERSCELRLAQIERVLGVAMSADEVATLIGPIGFTVTPTSGDTVSVSLPSWRPDCCEEIDVIEEVARHHGYDRLGKRVPKSTMHGALSVVQQRRRLLRQILLGAGVTEALPNPFLAPDDLERAGLSGPVVSITNPLVAEESVLRTSLRPGLLKAVAFNESHRRPGVSLFEIGRVYPPGTGVLPDEHEMLAVVLAGREAPAALALWKEIAAGLGVGARIDQSTVPAGLHPTRSATLLAGKRALGAVGEVHPDVADAYDVDERVAVLELDLSQILPVEPKPATWKPTSRYPSSDIDLAFVVPDEVPAERVDKAIRQATGALLADLTLFDVYRGAGVADGHRSLAYRLRLQAADRTLTDAEVGQLRERCITTAAKTGAVLRG